MTTEILTIRALSLWQPWASLVACGVKRHETRHWMTNHRGPIAIHAAKTLDRAGAPEALCQAALGMDWMDQCPLGAVVAVADLTACAPTEALFNLTRADQASGNYTDGRFGWRLDNVRPLLEPIPLAGRQGLFSWARPDDLESLLDHPVDHQAACARIGWA